MAGEDDMATALTLWLTDPASYPAGRMSPIQMAVRERMRRIAEDMAAVIVNRNPFLREKIEELIKASVADALRDDVILRGIVTNAVAKALVKNQADGD